MLKNYLKLTWKILLRRKFFTAISIFGISFTLTVVMIVTALLDHSFGPKAPELKIQRMLFATDIVLSGENNSMGSTPSYDFLRRYVKPLQAPQAVTIFSVPSVKSTYRNGKRIDIHMRYTDEIFWEVYDFHLLDGRHYTRQELERSERVAVISEKMRQEFFSDREAVGQFLELEKTRYRIIGIVEDVSPMYNTAFSDLWVPHTIVSQKVNELGMFGNFRATLLAHSRRDFSKIKQEFQQVLQQVQVPDPKRFETIFCPLETKETQTLRHAMGIRTDRQTDALFYFIVAGGTLLFMMLPAINLININMSRIAERASEIGIRKAFGATTLTLTWQFLLESLFLTLLGSVLGAAFSAIILSILTQSGIIPYAELTLNGRVFVYFWGCTLLFGIFSGVYPAYRMSKLQPVEALTGGRA